MHLRTVAIALAVFAATWAEPRPQPASAGPQATSAIRGVPVQPLPFLASGLVLLQAPAAEAGPSLTPARLSRVQLPGPTPEARVRGTKRTAAPAQPITRRAEVLAGRLGTPPPAHSES